MAEVTGKSWFRVEAIDDGTAEFYVYDYIGEYGVSGKDFVKSFKAAMRGRTRADIHINSPGGDIAQAYPIYNAIKATKAERNVYIDGIALSAASYLAMAGDTVRIAENGIMLLHEPSTIAGGTAKEMRKTAEFLDTHRDAMVKAYAVKSGKSEDEIKAILEAESIYSADEAVEEGFADEVYTFEGATKAYACAEFDPQKYTQQYKSLRPEIVSAALKGVLVTAEAENNKQGSEPMADDKKSTATTPDPAPLDEAKIRAEAAEAAIKAERARIAEIKAAAFDDQDELVEKLIKDGTDITEAVKALNRDAKERGAKTLAQFKAASDKIDVQNDGQSDAPPVEAKIEDLERTNVKAYLSMGFSRDEAEKRAKAFVGR
jgi:ATP-dependent Clp protease protease subunit